ncbi:hypothetical protein ACOMHN_035224 [Nucella lapillus]
MSERKVWQMVLRNGLSQSSDVGEIIGSRVLQLVTSTTSPVCVVSGVQSDAALQKVRELLGTTLSPQHTS